MRGALGAAAVGLFLAWVAAPRRACRGDVEDSEVYENRLIVTKPTLYLASPTYGSDGSLSIDWESNGADVTTLTKDELAEIKVMAEASRKARAFIQVGTTS